MSKESALLFLKKMQEDLKFRNYIENLGLDEQEKAAKNSGLAHLFSGYADKKTVRI